MANRAYEFLNLYKQLEDALENRVTARDKTRGSLVMDLSNSDEGIPWRDRLNLCREVRNLISHNADLGGEPPVEPAEALVDSLREILQAVTSQPPAMTRATPFEALLTAKMSDAAVPLMRRMSESGFSHAPVVQGDKLKGVFSVSTLFAAGLQGRRFTLTMDTLVGDFADLLPPDRHMTERFSFIHEKALLPEVKALFDAEGEDRPRRVAAVFLTDSGASDGAIKGLLTPWDIIKPAVNVPAGTNLPPVSPLKTSNVETLNIKV